MLLWHAMLVAQCPPTHDKNHAFLDLKPSYSEGHYDDKSRFEITKLGMQRSRAVFKFETLRAPATLF